jgi:hypothetical protein
MIACLFFLVKTKELNPQDTNDDDANAHRFSSSAVRAQEHENFALDQLLQSRSLAEVEPETAGFLLPFSPQVRRIGETGLDRIPL